MTATSRAALRRARARFPAVPDLPQYLTPSDMLRPLSDHALDSLRDDIDREFRDRAYIALTAAIRFHLQDFGLQEHAGATAVAATFTVTTTHVDGPWWDETDPTIRYADGFERRVNFAGTTVDDELVELADNSAERPARGQILTVPLLTP
ncbi:hypothetical protein [Streptomyces sp. MBT27]|uniref:hypothetical protein n=1 Tax=Streptomyces sp. MBT27 TaxID=1488356 RepID=UPI001422595E|nr:hypothetical protein [Streptomyces sp. MBT27]